jgi:tetratricopeptide (TPR) repeat protein
VRAGRFAEAARLRAATTLDAPPLNATPVGVVHALLQLDDLEEARRRIDKPDHDFALGALAFAEGQYDKAVRMYREAERLPDGPLDSCRICGDFDIGRAFDRAGQADSAIVAYEHFVRTPFHAREALDAQYRAWIVRRLGELFHAKGDLAKASEYYREFVEQWTDADPALQPQVSEVRARLERIAEEMQRRG